MADAVALLASLAGRVAMALPGSAYVAPFERIDGRGFELARRGIGPRSYGLVDQLAETFPPATLMDVVADADRHATTLTGVLGGRAKGYRWARDDDETEAWYPQGVTGSADAQPDGLVSGRVMHAISWYSKRGSGSRVSFVEAGRNPRYRHVLLVRPTGGDGFALVHVHAGGIAWVGHLLYVVDTRHGLRVFDTERILRVPRARLEDARDHRYVLPQVGSYRSTGDELAHSFVSLDRPPPTAGARAPAPSLLVGEYKQAKGGRIARWAVDPDSCLIASTAPTEAYAAPVDRLQGVTSIDGLLLGSSSRIGGRLYVGRPGERTRQHFWWPYLPEDLYHSAASGEIYSVTEAPGRRMVFGVALSELGL